jgi:hypothetical protein
VCDGVVPTSPSGPPTDELDTCCDATMTTIDLTECFHFFLRRPPKSCSRIVTFVSTGELVHELNLTVASGPAASEYSVCTSVDSTSRLGWFVHVLITTQLMTIPLHAQRFTAHASRQLCGSVPAPQMRGNLLLRALIHGRTQNICLDGGVKGTHTPLVTYGIIQVFVDTARQRIESNHGLFSREQHHGNTTGRPAVRFPFTEGSGDLGRSRQHPQRI